MTNLMLSIDAVDVAFIPCYGDDCNGRLGFTIEEQKVLFDSAVEDAPECPNPHCPYRINNNVTIGEKEDGTRISIRITNQ